MTFMRKFLDLLKIEDGAEDSTAKEDNCQEYEADIPEDASEIFGSILYQDDHVEECYLKNDYKEISFSKWMFNNPAIQLCAALLLSQSKHGMEISDKRHYSLYYEGVYGITNIEKLHYWLYEKGYLREATLTDALGLYKVPELKMILESIGLKKTGKKADLINRIESAIDDTQKAQILRQCDRLFLTQKGEEFLEENWDLVLFHRKRYFVTFNEFCAERFLQNKKRRFNDTIFQILSEKAYQFERKGHLSMLGLIYEQLSSVCYDDGNMELSLRYAIFSLYFYANLSNHLNLFNLDFVELNGIEEMKKEIYPYNVFPENIMNKILSLKDFYQEGLLDLVYDMQMLPYTLFFKYDMADAIYDLCNKVFFDAEFYTNYVRINYGKYISQFLE